MKREIYEKGKINIVAILVLIIIILLIILGVKMLFPQKNFKPLVSEEIKAKILSAPEDNKNFTYTSISNDGRVEKKIKDNIIVTYQEKTGVYSYFNPSKRTYIAGNTKTGKYARSSFYESAVKKDFLRIDEVLELYGKEIYHIKDKKYKGKTCHVVELREDAGTSAIWVDKDTGFILKYEPIESERKIEFEIEFNNVTDEDIKEPQVNMYR